MLGGIVLVGGAGVARPASARPAASCAARRVLVVTDAGVARRRPRRARARARSRRRARRRGLRRGRARTRPRADVERGAAAARRVRGRPAGRRSAAAAPWTAPRASTSCSPTAAGWRTTGAPARRSAADAAVDRRADDRRHRQRGAVLRADRASRRSHRKMACGDEKARFPAVLLDPELAAHRAPRGRGDGRARRRRPRGREPSSPPAQPGLRALCSREAWRLLEPALRGAARSAERRPRRLERPAARRAPRGRGDRGLDAGRRARLRQPADRALRRSLTASRSA